MPLRKDGKMEDVRSGIIDILLDGDNDNAKMWADVMADQILSLISKTDRVATSPAGMAGSATLIGFTKEEVKAMVEGVYGAIEWVWREKDGQGVLTGYPNAKGEVFIAGE